MISTIEYKNQKGITVRVPGANELDQSAERGGCVASFKSLDSNMNLSELNFYFAPRERDLFVGVLSNLLQVPWVDGAANDGILFRTEVQGISLLGVGGKSTVCKASIEVKYYGNLSSRFILVFTSGDTTVLDFNWPMAQAGMLCAAMKISSY